MQGRWCKAFAPYGKNTVLSLCQVLVLALRLCLACCLLKPCPAEACLPSRKTATTVPGLRRIFPNQRCSLAVAHKPVDAYLPAACFLQRLSGCFCCR